MERPRSVMDLGILFQVLKDRGLKYRIGNIRTPGDGNCFLSMMMMNILHFQDAGSWTGRVPTDVDELRCWTIQNMKDNKHLYVGTNCPLTEEDFKKLIETQSKLDSECDEEGYFVAACCRLLKVELTIIRTHGEPVIPINRGVDQITFSCGLIRNESSPTGHYQFIYPGEPDSIYVPPTEVFPTPVRNAGNIKSVLRFTYVFVILNFKVVSQTSHQL